MSLIAPNPHEWRLDLYEDLKRAGLLYAIDVKVPKSVVKKIVEKIRESRQASPGCLETEETNFA
jgi:hypothetical protein